MPVYYTNQTTYKLLKLSNAILFCNNAQEVNSFSVSTKKMTTGIANSGFRDIGLLNRTFSINGPCLMSSEGFLGDLNYSAQGYRILDVPSFVIDILSGTSDYGTNINGEIIPNVDPIVYDKYPIIEKASLKMDNSNGLNADINIKGNVGKDIDSINMEYLVNYTGEITNPLRSSNWYDLKVEYKKYGNINMNCDVPDEIITIGFNNISFEYDFDWKELEYIGQNQHPNYIYNGGKVNYNFELTYNFPNYSTFSTFYQYTQDNVYGFLPTMNELLGYTICFNQDDTSSFSYRLFELMNSYWEQSGVSGMGKQARAQFMSGATCIDGAKIEHNISISHQYPISTITIQGERIFN